jgi:hypothetical protein
VFTAHSIAAVSSGQRLDLHLNLAMAGSIEQRVWDKFCDNIGKTANEACQMMQIEFGDVTISQAQVLVLFHLRVEGGNPVEINRRICSQRA